MNRLFYLKHSAINVYFSKNSKDFIVSEIPLYDFSGDGEHLILKVRKKSLTTWQMLQIFSEVTGIKKREFGYAGLKDKDGLTIQYISMPKIYEKRIESFLHDKIKILESTYHKNKLKIGHLRANRFFVRLKKVNGIDAKKLKEALKSIKTYGLANYFGYQRFGKNRDNFLRGKEILESKVKEKNKRVEKFLISAYQSHLFNLWLSKRVKISKLIDSFEVNELSELLSFPKEIIKKLKSQKSFFKLLPGDMMHHYPYGKDFVCENLDIEQDRFFKKEITPTGLLVGKKALKAYGIAADIERDFEKECEEFLQKMNGTRRFAWIWAEDIEYKYIESEAWFELSFTLPKGSYATVLLEELTHQKGF